MTKYKSGETAEIGDIVQCVVPECHPYHSLSDARTYKVTRAGCDVVCIKGFGDATYRKDRFILLKRTGATPLVKWPEEETEPLRRFGQLKPGDFFVFNEWPQDVRIRVHDNGCIRLFDKRESGRDGCVLRYSDTCPVRRVRLISEPRFEVI